MTLPVKRNKDPRRINTSSVTLRHPFGVKPQGNAFLSDPKYHYNLRKSSLGHLSVLSDDALMELLGFIDDLDSLKSLLATSKYLFTFLNDEELWKKWYNKNSGTEVLKWNGSWKKSVLGWKQDIILQVELNSDVVYRPFQVANIDYKKLFNNLVQDELHMKNNRVNSEGRIPRFPQMSQQEFDDIKTPFILTGYEWPDWTLEHLNGKYGAIEFQQESVRWPLSTFINYLQSNTDENPLYLFDCRSTAMDQLRTQYKHMVPEIFKQDYFKLLGESRPDHSWLIAGSKRSGSTFHKDPNNTSAWNACVTGMKLWVMLPPHITPPGVTVSEDQSEITSPVGIGEWVLSGFYHDVLKIPDTLIGITFPNECMYVPSNWWHLVINLEDSIAITENFVPEKDLGNVMNFFKNRPKQISGFKLNDIKRLITKLKDPNPQIKDFLIQLNQLNIDLYEDCGEIENLPEVPIFEIFKQLMIENGHKELIEKIIEEIKPKPKRKQWSLNEDTSESFSFNFSFD